jgi:hypothetical protein
VRTVANMSINRWFAVTSVAMSILAACSGGDGASDAPAAGAGPSSAAPGEGEGEGAPGADGTGGSTGGGSTEPGASPSPSDDGGAESGADAAIACGPAAGDGAGIASTCTAAIFGYFGGPIVPGTYDLVAVAVAGTQQLCDLHKPATYAGRLDVTSSVKGGWVFHERVTTSKGSEGRSFVAGIDGITLDVTQTCGATLGEASWAFSSFEAAGQQRVLYSRDEGGRKTRYTWAIR